MSLELSIFSGKLPDLLQLSRRVTSVQQNSFNVLNHSMHYHKTKFLKKYICLGVVVIKRENKKI